MTTPVLQGSLAAFKLPEVLTFLNTARKSGTLTAANDAREASLFFDKGSLIYAASNQEQYRLGQILLRKKHITREHAEKIDALMRSVGGRFGQIAVQQGVLTDAQLLDALKVQVSEIVYDCFVWTGGTFAFAEELQLPAHAVTISIDLANLIMEGARRIDEWEQCLKLLPEKSAVYRVVTAPKDEKITLTSEEWKILFLINGQRTLEELCHDADDDPFHVYKLVYGLLANKLIEPSPKDLREGDTSRGLQAITTAPVAPAPPIAESTVRQSAPVFHAESTVREAEDDTNLLVSTEARLTYGDVVKPTIAQLVMKGMDGDSIVPLTEPEYLVGRSRENSIQIPDLGVSGFHSRIFRGPEGYVIEDLKSRNGTWVNGSRVFHATLKDGDKLRLGATELSYQVLFPGAS